jgi:hypothetical protein
LETKTKQRRSYQHLLCSSVSALVIRVETILLSSCCLYEGSTFCNNSNPSFEIKNTNFIFKYFYFIKLLLIWDIPKIKLMISNSSDFFFISLIKLKAENTLISLTYIFLIWLLCILFVNYLDPCTRMMVLEIVIHHSHALFKSRYIFCIFIIHTYIYIYI